MHYVRLMRNGTTDYMGRTYDRAVCTVEGCDGWGKQGGLCGKHDARLRRTGTTDDPPPRRKDLDARLWDRLLLDDCWLWPGAHDRNGYGQMWYEGRLWRVHRLVYTLLVEPWPDGLVADHTCRNSACCHPDHVEPVTNAENVRRAWEAKRAGLPAYTHLYS